MSRPTLKIARAVKRTGPPLAMVKKALRLFSGRGITREVRHQNARKWLASMAALGDKHTLHASRPAVKWGQPGQPSVGQIFAPRVLGAKP